MAAYLDHAATTPLRSEAAAAMMPFLADAFGNPSGSHGVGRAARQAIDEARDAVAEALGAQPGEVIFTSGGTESDNLAVAGAAGVTTGSIVCSAVEHHAVLRAVEAQGARAEVVPVLSSGLIDLDALESVLDESVSLVSVMLVNNEVGVIQPLHKVRRLMERRAAQAKLHTDAVQAVSWLDVAGYTGFADLVSLSAHKFGGPQGVGALIARNGVKLTPLLHGGGQERERRSGTQNVAGIVGMAAALRSTVDERSAAVDRVSVLRDRLVDGLLAAVSGARETVPRASKIAANAHLYFEGVESEALLVLLDEAGVYASAGASCSSGAMEPSHVLTAMGFGAQAANSSLRLTLGHSTTAHDIDLALKVIPDAVLRLRGSN